MSIMEATDLAVSALERMGIEDKAHCMPETLSGGEQQRVALIRTFLYPASIILLDEPFYRVESDTQRRYYEYDKSVASRT